MLVLLTIFFSSFVIALSGAMMPGPLLTATISESSQRGFIAGPLLIIGHGILELALVITLLLGLAPFLMREEVFIVIAIAGAGFLLWMALKMFHSLPSLHLSLDVERSDRNHLVISGALLSIANPYWLVWWATIGLGYLIHSKRFGLLGIFFFFTGHFFADFTWYAAVAAAVGKGRHFLSDRVYRIIIGICATFLVIFACYFIYAALQKSLS
jgi:threonine/homoserine/homoserine lactone efflux protein